MIQNVAKLISRLRSVLAWRRLRQYAILGSGVFVPHRFSWRLPLGENRLVVGDNTHLGGRIVVQGKGRVIIGQYCSFRDGSYFGAVGSIHIGNNVYGAEGVFITDNNNHPTSPEARRQMTLTAPNSTAWKWTRPDVQSAPVVIEDAVWLGRYSTILKGVTIGRGSIVAANAVVTRSVPPFSVVAGNPSKVVRTLTNDLD